MSCLLCKSTRITIAWTRIAVLDKLLIVCNLVLDGNRSASPLCAPRFRFLEKVSIPFSHQVSRLYSTFADDQNEKNSYYYVTWPAIKPISILGKGLWGDSPKLFGADGMLD